MKKFYLILLLLAFAMPYAGAQPYVGEVKYDGVHRNEVKGYVMGGSNVVTGGFGGLAASYKRHFNHRWSAEADAQMQFGKQLFSIYAQGGYRLPWRSSGFHFNLKMMYSRYHRFSANEYNINVSAVWEHPYFFLHIGETWIRYHLHTGEGYYEDSKTGYGYTEPLTFTFGVGVTVRPRSSWWNIGAYFRNYDDFYYENWNINWGLNFAASLTKQMRLFGELNIRPAGSMSQLASRYEVSGKMGLRYLLK